MERTIKFIWDYFGPPAIRTAEHHNIHLREFAEAEQLSIQKTGFEKHSDEHASAYILLAENDALRLKDVLKPHKAIVEKDAWAAAYQQYPKAIFA